MMDDDDSGRVSMSELQVFLRTIAPQSVGDYDISSLANEIMRQADTNNSGQITFSEFMSWDNKKAVLDWLDSYYYRMLGRYSQGGSAAVTTSYQYPWEAITTADLVRVFKSESWGGTLVLSEFLRALDKLELNSGAIGAALFDAFDLDKNGYLEFREMFLGLALLLSGTKEEKLECAFSMMDANGTGRVSREELEVFLKAIAPKTVSRPEISNTTSVIMDQADTNRSGLITWDEFMAWNGKASVLAWLDQYYDMILSRYSAYGTQTSYSKAADANLKSQVDVAILDRDGDGQISEAEWKTGGGSAFGNVGTFQAIDKDGDGKISQEELQEAMINPPKTSGSLKWNAKAFKYVGMTHTGVRDHGVTTTSANQGTRVKRFEKSPGRERSGSSYEDGRPVSPRSMSPRSLRGMSPRSRQAMGTTLD
jgi:Ca2+-binding EF-hand superfamily protein